MKTFLVAAFLLTLSAIATNAQTPCDTDAQTVIYNRFLEQAKAPLLQRATASLTAKEYLTKFAECTTEPEKKINEFLKDWLDRYEAAVTDFNCSTAVNRQPARAFELCKPYLARDPENLRAYLLLSHAGIKSGDKKLRPETVRAARKALGLVKSGKSVERWQVAETKDEAVATLEFYAAYYTIDTTPAETATTMSALARSNSSFNKDPNTFFYLAQALQQSELKKLKAEYVQTCGGSDPPDTCDASWTKIESVMDRIIDAYARAIVLSTGKPEFAPIAVVAKPELAKVYRVRHEKGTDAEIEKFIAGVLSTPIP